MSEAALKLSGVVRTFRQAGTSLEVLRGVDLAIAGGGSICWELSHMGLPAVLMVMADNQRPIALDLDLRGVARRVGEGDSCSTDELAQCVSELAADPAARSAMGSAGRSLIDGLGAQRVASALADSGDGS